MHCLTLLCHVSRSVFRLLVMRETEAITFNLFIFCSHRYNRLTVFSFTQRQGSSTTTSHQPTVLFVWLIAWHWYSMGHNQLKWNKITIPTKHSLMLLFIPTISHFLISLSEQLTYTKGCLSWDHILFCHCWNISDQGTRNHSIARVLLMKFILIDLGRICTFYMFLFLHILTIWTQSAACGSRLFSFVSPTNCSKFKQQGFSHRH